MKALGNGNLDHCFSFCLESVSLLILHSDLLFFLKMYCLWKLNEFHHGYNFTTFNYFLEILKRNKI